MVKKEGGGWYLRWPWNLAVYILLAASLRLFSIPFILLLMWHQRKNNPHGALEGYCLTRTRQRLSWLAWGLLLVVVGICLGAFFYVGLEQDADTRDAMDYVTLVITSVGGVVLTAGGVYMSYIALRDAFFPAKSGLADSIRRQLPYPEEAPPVEELFAMVDEDLKENGQWFGPVGIGREWVLGELANRIDRIRGIFVIDEIHRHHTKTGTRSSRVLQLVLIDDRWQRNATSFQSPGDLKAAADCLCLRVPEAARGQNGQASAFWTMDEEEREEFERNFRQRQGLRTAEEVQRTASGGPVQNMILLSGGETTSRVSLESVEEKLRQCLEAGSGAFTLTPTQAIRGRDGSAFRAMYVSVSEGELWLAAEPADKAGYGLARRTEEGEALEILSAWLRREAPDVAGWELRRIYDASARETGPRPSQRQAQPDELALLRATGAGETHTTFTREDVEVAAEGLVDGSYQKVRLSLHSRFLLMEIIAGDASDARCTVRASRPDPDKLRFFEAKTTPRQAAEWLRGYYAGSFLPGGSEWKDYTKQVEKRK